MGAGASIPDTEEEARQQGYTERQIEDYKASIQKLAMENALSALAARKARQSEGAAADAKDTGAPRVRRDSKK